MSAQTFDVRPCQQEKLRKYAVVITEFRRRSSVPGVASDTLLPVEDTEMDWSNLDCTASGALLLAEYE